MRVTSGHRQPLFRAFCGSYVSEGNNCIEHTPYFVRSLYIYNFNIDFFCLITPVGRLCSLFYLYLRVVICKQHAVCLIKLSAVHTISARTVCQEDLPGGIKCSALHMLDHLEGVGPRYPLGSKRLMCVAIRIHHGVSRTLANEDASLQYICNFNLQTKSEYTNKVIPL